MEQLEQVFRRQAKLTEDFHRIYDDNHLLVHRLIPVDLSTRTGQFMLHMNLHWGMVELSEALFEFDVDKKQKELIDVLHFIVEFSILAGFTHQKLFDGLGLAENDPWQGIMDASIDNPLVFQQADDNIRFTIIAALLIATILPGGKPWKQSDPKLPEPKLLKEATQALFYWWGASARTAGIVGKDVMSLYLDKNTENHNRINSGV